jgi:hypothetical protein
MTMEQSEGIIILENNLSEKFSVFKGDNLSTVFLNKTVDQIIKKLLRGTIASNMTQMCMQMNSNGRIIKSRE